MELSLHKLKPKIGSKKSRKRVGRGNASGHGTYSTRGLKGQRSRSGAGGLKLKGLKQNLLNVPKLRGFKSDKPKAYAIGLDTLEKKFNDGEKINLKTLYVKGLIKKSITKVKILNNGEIKKKLQIDKDIMVSASAKEKIEKAGGRIS